MWFGRKTEPKMRLSMPLDGAFSESVSYTHLDVYKRQAATMSDASSAAPAISQPQSPPEAASPSGVSAAGTSVTSTVAAGETSGASTGTVGSAEGEGEAEGARCL